MIAALIGWAAPYLAAIAAAAAGIAVAYLKGRGDGAANAESKTLRGTVAAKEEQLEMHREADQIEREISAMTDDQARQEAERWARR